MDSLTAGSLCARMLVVLLLAAVGCGPGYQPRPKTLSTFGVDIVPGILSHDIVLTNNNQRDLEQVDLTATVYFEDSEIELTRHWAYWRHEENQTFNVPAGTTRIQRIKFTGTAVAGAEKEAVQLSADWLFSYEDGTQ